MMRDEQDDKTMGLKIPPLLRPDLPVPGEAVELGPRVDLQRREVHRTTATRKSSTKTQRIQAEIQDKVRIGQDNEEDRQRQLLHRHRRICGAVESGRSRRIVVPSETRRSTVSSRVGPKDERQISFSTP